MDSETKDSFLELEKSLEKKDRAKKLKKILIPTVIIIALVIILVIVLVLVLKKEDKKEDNYDGSISAKYIINDVSKKIKIINIPRNKINISIFINNNKIIDLKDNETEILFNKSSDNNIELKYKGK